MQYYRTQWRVFALFMASVVAMSSVFSISVQAAPSDEVTALQKEIDAKNAKIKEIQNKISQYNSAIQKKQLERVSLSNQVSLIENRIAKLDLDIKGTALELEELMLEIRAVQASIEEKATHIRTDERHIAQFIREMHSFDQKNTVEILVANPNLSSFFTTVQHTKTLQEGLTNASRSLQKAKGELEQKHTEKKKKQRDLENLKIALADKKENFATQKNMKVTLIEETAQSEQKFKSLVSNLRKEYESIENEIEAKEREMRKKLESSKKSGYVDPGGTGNLSWPVPSKVVTAYFHDPDYPFRHVFEHPAVDIRAGQGTTVRAAGSGFVGRARRCSSYLCYSYVLLVHQNGLSTVYGHMSNILVNEGDFVTRGDIIGYSGGTPKTVGAGPFVTGAHLHFETRVNGIPVNPLNYLN